MDGSKSGFKDCLQQSKIFIFVDFFQPGFLRHHWLENIWSLFIPITKPSARIDLGLNLGGANVQRTQIIKAIMPGRGGRAV